MIFGIVWQSARAVFTRMLDGSEPEIPGEIRHAAEHVPGIREIGEVRARWLGHRLAVEVDAIIDGSKTVKEADEIVSRLERELAGHLPALGRSIVRVRPFGSAMSAPAGIASVSPKAEAHDLRHGGDHEHGGHGHGHDHPHSHGHDHPHKDHDHPHPHKAA
jgi:hypothetical protein